METLQELVRNLIIILLLAMVLEMILPNKSMRGYVQFVMGLFVIAAILSPVTELLHMPLEMDIPAWTVTEAELPVLATDKVGTDSGQSAVEEQFRLILINQIKSLAVGVTGVQEAEVEVEFAEDSQGGTVEPELKLVTIKLTRGDKESKVQPVEPIVIGQTPPDRSKQQTQLTEEVQERVTVIMGITRDIVFVWEE